MEEDIKVLEELLNYDFNQLSKEEYQAIENLIAKNKELEEKTKTLKSLSNAYNRLWIAKCEEYNSLERKIEKIEELNIPVETLIAEFNRLEDLEDDREQLNDYIKDLQKKLTNAIEIKYIHKDYIPKSKVRKKIEELEKEYDQFVEWDREDDCMITREIIEILEDLLQEGDK